MLFLIHTIPSTNLLGIFQDLGDNNVIILVVSQHNFETVKYYSMLCSYDKIINVACMLYCYILH